MRYSIANEGNEFESCNPAYIAIFIQVQRVKTRRVCATAGARLVKNLRVSSFRFLRTRERNTRERRAVNNNSYGRD